MAGVIGASGSNTIRTRTMAERSRMQDMPDMVSQQKEEVQNAAVMPARDTHQGEDSIVLHIRVPGRPAAVSAGPLFPVQDRRRAPGQARLHPPARRRSHARTAAHAGRQHAADQTDYPDPHDRARRTTPPQPRS
jgi:hypothetical protein